MLVTEFKVGAIALAVGLIAGAYAGYSIRDDKALIDELESAHFALKTENNQLIRQLEIEHEQQQKSKEITAQTQEDLAELEKRYDNAVNELHSLQLQYEITDSGNTPALPDHADTANTVSEGKSGCSLSDQRKLQKVINEQMMVARDCDINATYLNNLIEWYGSISK